MASRRVVYLGNDTARKYEELKLLVVGSSSCVSDACTSLLTLYAIDVGKSSIINMFVGCGSHDHDSMEATTGTHIHTVCMEYQSANIKVQVEVMHLNVYIILIYLKQRYMTPQAMKSTSSSYYATAEMLMVLFSCMT